jgi:hypothetical protein
MDETRAIKAADLVADPDQAHFFQQAFILITDTSLNATFTNLVAAINMLAEAGWEIGNLTSDSSVMYVLCKNPHFKPKRKPGGETQSDG